MEIWRMEFSKNSVLPRPWPLSREFVLLKTKAKRFTNNLFDVTYKLNVILL